MAPILMDMDHNSKTTVMKNLEGIFLLAAHKLMARLDKLEKSVLGFVNEDFIAGKSYM